MFFLSLGIAGTAVRRNFLRTRPKSAVYVKIPLDFFIPGGGRLFLDYLKEGKTMKRSNILLSVALIVVAILAGCSNDSVYPAFPQSATITQTGDFMLGQEFDSSKFQVVVTYLDGSVKTLNNAVLTFTDGTPADGVTAGDKVSISVGTDYNGKEVKTE